VTPASFNPSSPFQGLLCLLSRPLFAITMIRSAFQILLLLFGVSSLVAFVPRHEVRRSVSPPPMPSVWKATTVPTASRSTVRA
jgi:hypothetical protein